MKRNHGIIFIAVCFLCSNTFATLSAERNKYKTMYVPYNNKDFVANVPRDSLAMGYDPIEVCGKPEDLTVTYEVKCDNGLHYEGKDYLLSSTRKLNETWATNSEEAAFK